MKFKLLITLLLLLFTLVGHAFDPICSEFFLPPTPKVALEQIQELKLGTYNVLNLSKSVGHYEDINGVRTFIPGSSLKPLEQTQGVAKAILEAKLDIVVLQEVEGIEALENFGREFLDNKYFPISLRGNDERGIDIGFLVKKNLPFEIQMDSYKAIKWIDPSDATGSEKLLFSRDLPVMKIYFTSAQPRGPPDMVLIGTHFKSQRDRARDPKSRIFREAQVKETTRIIREMQNTYGSRTPILLAGDFNGDIHNSEFRHLTETGLLEEAFEVKQIPASQRVTHTYHPRGGATEESQLDAFMFTPNFRHYVKDAGVHRYKNPDGSVKPLPQSYAEREQNPSDHFMVKMTVDFSAFYRRSP
jgi:endonuclease/exonuclease/phosphatase family metal-dependent hydrolase